MYKVQCCICGRWKVGEDWIQVKIINLKDFIVHTCCPDCKTKSKGGNCVCSGMLCVSELEREKIKEMGNTNPEGKKNTSL